MGQLPLYTKQKTHLHYAPQKFTSFIMTHSLQQFFKISDSHIEHLRPALTGKTHPYHFNLPFKKFRVNQVPNMYEKQKKKVTTKTYFRYQDEPASNV